MLRHPSLVQIPEAQLVERLTADPHWRSYLLGIKSIASNVVPFRSVPFTGLPGEPQGDVDLLLNVPGRPALATAVEAKRIKVGAAALRDRRPNKLHEFREGVWQANLLAKIGFSQVYLFVFVIVDSREPNGGRITYDGLPADLASMTSGFISPLGLDQRIGLIYYELVQPMDDEPLGTGMYGGHLIRLAEPSAQPKEVTAWVARISSAGAT